MSLQDFEFAVFSADHLDEDATAVWVRNSLLKLNLESVGLTPMEYAREWWDAGDPLIVGGGAMLTHPRLADEANDESWAMALDYLGYSSVTGVLGAVPTAPFDVQGRSKTWPWLADFLERLVHASAASLCVINVSGDDEANELPDESEMQPALPRAVTAWNYIGGPRLKSVDQKKLALLDAFSSKPLVDGWVLRPIEYFSDPLRPGFLPDYQAVTGGPVRFLRGDLEHPRPQKPRSGAAERARKKRN